MAQDSQTTCPSFYILPTSHPMGGRRQWHPTPAPLPGKSHGRRSLVRCSLWGRWEFCLLQTFFFQFYLFIYLLYNIVLALPYIDMNLPWLYMCSPSWTPPPTSLRIPSLWVIPVRQPLAPCIMHRTWTGNTFLIW